MTTKKQIGHFVSPLMSRNPDLFAVETGRFWLLPIGHVGKEIRILTTSRADKFTMEWSLCELFMPESSPGRYHGRCHESISRSKQFVGGTGWNWSDPTMAGDFIERIEADALPILRSVDTVEKSLNFSRGHAPSKARRGWQWYLVAAIALGELDTARTLWGENGHHYVKGRIVHDPILQFMKKPVVDDPTFQLTYDRFCEIGEPLMADDRQGLAELLRLWEFENVRGTLIEPHWVPLPFPLEQTG